ncbi:TrmB family transcriptional regulator [Halostella pelagica]|uniref:TrmB family transcriptional regulator n=1 Tax=Halostella pelagica TaxID=2583824 RepID=UPI001081620F|nr:TrmB family transcriptional regulator [Halostella pelagica]
MKKGALIDHLRRFGFSETEIETYLTILEHGSAKASTIAEDADVSNRYVYNVVERFEDRGFVEVNDHVTPSTIVARPPSEVVAALREDLERIESELEDRFNAPTELQQDVQVIKSRSTAYNRTVVLIDGATEVLTLSLPASVVPKVRDALLAAVDRGVLTLVLVTGVDDSVDETAFDGIGNVVRVWSETAPMLLTVDQQSALFMPSELISGEQTDNGAISLVQDQLVPSLTSSILGNYWQISDETWVAEPSVLPRTYSMFRHAVLDAALHLRDGGPIDARIETRDGETIDGRIVDVRQGLAERTTSRFPIENTIVVETPSGRVTVGGRNAFIEEYQAAETVLSQGDTRKNGAS